MRIIAVLTTGLSLAYVVALPLAGPNSLVHKHRSSAKRGVLLERARPQPPNSRSSNSRNFAPAQRQSNSPRGNSPRVYQSIESAPRTPPLTIDQVFLDQEPHPSDQGTLPRTQFSCDPQRAQFTVYLANDNPHASENLVHGNAVLRNARIAPAEDQYLPISGDQEEWLPETFLGGREFYTTDERLSMFAVDTIPDAERQNIMTVLRMVQQVREANAEFSRYSIRFVPFHSGPPPGWRPYIAPHLNNFPTPQHLISGPVGSGNWVSLLADHGSGSGSEGYGSARVTPETGQYPGYPQQLSLPPEFRSSYGDYRATNILYASPSPGAVFHPAEDPRWGRSGAPTPPSNRPSYHQDGRRDVITGISLSEAAPNATQQRIEDLEDILWALQELRANATELMIPVINHLVNGTNNTLVNSMALSIYAMVHPGVSVFGPFVNGMSSLASLMGSTTTNNSATSAFVSIVNRKYADAWGNATVAANSTGLLAQIAVLENALNVGANETHLLPTEWTTVQEDPNLDFFIEGSDPYSPFGAYGYWFEFNQNSSTAQNSSYGNSTAPRA